MATEFAEDDVTIVECGEDNGQTGGGDDGEGSGAENGGGDTSGPNPAPKNAGGKPNKSSRRYSGFRNRQYSEAYGDYSGGYGPPMFGPGPPRGPSRGPGPMFGPPQFFGPGPGSMMGARGPPGPMGPPRRRFQDDRAVKYLLSCGVSRESLKNLPRSVLDIMEPHYCGICGFHCESFHMSRIHYISRNHQKKVNKWLDQTDSRQQNFSKDPMKSRDMYCELCDVQITSKVHADSHYSGKPHRAAVEGRKAPKNPKLLQPGMESRLGQLIRREKRFLIAKPVEDAKPAAPKDPATTRPDLYCDICKTSMTCSEQMTAHLNGKRHLAKEKNHILRTMRGETLPGETAEDAGEGDGGGEGKEQEEAAPAAAADPANEEWSEDWE